MEAYTGKREAREKKWLGIEGKWKINRKEEYSGPFLVHDYF
jgi:hypothetical protein